MLMKKKKNRQKVAKLVKYYYLCSHEAEEIVPRKC